MVELFLSICVTGYIAKHWRRRTAWASVVMRWIPSLPKKCLRHCNPPKLELALGALRELEVRDQAMMRQWQMRVERAEYEAALAERRYEEVDPSNRLVAGTLGVCRE